MCACTKYNGASTSNPVIRFSSDEGLSWTAENTTLASEAVVGLPNQSTYDYVQTLPIKAPNGDILLHCPSNNGATRNGTTQFRSADGGTTWTSEGKIQSDNTVLGACDHCVSGSDIYASVFVDPGGDSVSPYTPKLLKSTDNGATWSTVSTMVVNGFNECSIDILPNGDMLSIMRSDDGLTTKKVVSSDNGATWGSAIDITSWLGKLQKPMTKRIGNDVFLFGRRMIGAFSGGADSLYGRQITEIYKTSDSGATWGGPWMYNDQWRWGCGYADFLPRSNGDLYFLDYIATSDSAAGVYEAVMS